MISVVIAVFNSNKSFLKKQLNSIKNQSILPTEVIIVDDCSNNGTAEAIKEYIFNNKLNSWSVFVNKKNIGYKNSFAKAISLTKGSIIVLADHDDIWLPDKLKLIREQFKKNKDILYLATSFKKIDENDKTIVTKERWQHANNNLIRRGIRKNELNKMSFQDIAIYNISPGCCCAFSSKIKQAFLKLYSYDLPHDWKLAVIAALNDGLYYLDKVTTMYRLHNRNTIGLGHESDYSKRIQLLLNGLNEKKAMVNVIGKIKMSPNVQELRYERKIIKLFYRRVSLMKSKKILKYGFPLLVRSLKFGKLYESILLDFVTICKENHRYLRLIRKR